ncbi:MAG: biotin/lipoyl-containing protein, partial [Planctomycetota bacterium]
MAVEIVMPRLSDTMEEGRIIKWLKQVGDAVAEGEPLLEVETDKADIEVEAFDTGVLLEITVEEGETVQAGEKIGLIGADGEAAAKPTPAKEAAEEAKEPEPEEKAEELEPKKEIEKPKEEKIVAEEKPKESARRGEPAVSIHMKTEEAIEKFVARRAPAKAPASPLAKELAQKHDVDLSEIQGTGPGGEVVKRDVESAAAKEGAQKPV